MPSTASNQPPQWRAERPAYLECLRAMGAIRRLYVRWSALPEWGRPLSLDALREEYRKAANGARRLRQEAGRMP